MKIKILAENVKLYPVLFDKSAPGYKDKDEVFNAWGAVAEKLEFVENGGHFSTISMHSHAFELVC